MPEPVIPHRPVFIQHPLAALFVSFALGVVLARFTALSFPLLLSCAAVCSILVVYFLTRRRNRAACLLLLAAFHCLGATVAFVEKRSVAPDRIRRLYETGLIESGDPVEVTGVIDRAPEPTPDGFYLSINVEKISFKEVERKTTGVVSLFAEVRDKQRRDDYGKLELRYGARVSVMTALRRADNFRNPGVSPFTEFLEQRGFDATGTIKSPLLVERLDDTRVFLPLAWLYDWRLKLLTLFEKKFSPETAGVLAASLLGNRYQLSRNAAERFRDGGTFHVLVISGLHISFIGLITLAIARRVTSRREWQFAATVAILWSYTLAVGAEASVVRAALMFTVVALAPVLHRCAKSLNALGGAGLALLVWRPSDLFDPSFQLTFLSVLAIVAIAWPLLRRLQEVGTWRPTRSTPRPPICSHWWRSCSELLYWSERTWQDEMKHSPWRCRLLKAPLAARLEKLHLQTPLRHVVSAVVVSATVQLVLLPFLVVYFHRLSLASILLNIIVGALMALLSFLALAAIVVSEISAGLAVPLVALTEAINWLMVHSVDPFASRKLASIRLPEYSWPSSIVYGVYYLPLGALTIKLARWSPVANAGSNKKPNAFVSRSMTRVTALAMMVAAFVVVMHPFSARRPDGRLHVDFLDVGQGDAALVTMPDGTTLLIDGGGQPTFDRPSEYGATEVFERDRRSIGEAVVSEYLWWRGLDQVDYIVATHADTDHIDGLNDVVRNFKVRSALVAREPGEDVEYARFTRATQSAGVPITLITRGNSLRIGEVIVEVLWPFIGNANAPSRNDDSTVLRIRYGDRSILLTGDIERKTESILAKDAEELKCDVIKVAHHGSKTSSIETFVAAARPSIAVISVGLASSYGHPHREVVERWRANGAQVMTTGQRGTISVSTDGRDLRVETFVP